MPWVPAKRKHSAANCCFAAVSSGIIALRDHIDGDGRPRLVVAALHGGSGCSGFFAKTLVITRSWQQINVSGAYTVLTCKRGYRNALSPLGL